ncbi:MAG: O-antigen ligase family protein [Flavobacteriales bacterium]
MSLFLLFIPLLFQNHLIEASNTPRFAFCVLGILLIVGFSLIRKTKWHAPDFSLIIPLVLFVAWCFFSIIWSINPAEAIYSAQRPLLITAALLLFYHLLERQENLIKIQEAVLFLIAICSIVVLVQTLFSTESADTYSIRFVFGHRNLLASFILLGSLFLLFDWEQKNAGRKKLILLTLLLSTTSLLLLQHRASYLALGFVGFALLFFGLKSKMNALSILKKVCFILIFIAAAFIAIYSNWHLFDPNSPDAMASMVERLQLWEKTLLLIQESPLLGHGAGNWPTVFPKNGIEEITKSAQHNIHFLRPHNEFLQIWSELGAVGIGLLLLFFFLLLRAFISTPSTSTSSMFGPISFLGCYGIYALLSFPSERCMHLLLLALALAYLIHHSGIKASIVNQNMGLKLLGAAVLIFSCLVFTTCLRGEFHARICLKAHEKQENNLVILHGNKSKSWCFNSDRNGSPLDFYIGAAHLNQQELDKAFHCFTSVQKIAPYDHVMLSNLGFVLELVGNDEEAKAHLLEARRINRYYQGSTLNLVVLEYNNGQYESALDHLKQLKNYEILYPIYLEKINAKLGAPTQH